MGTSTPKSELVRHSLTILLLGEVSHAVRGEVFQRLPLRSAPHYFEISVPNQVVLGEEEVVIGSQTVIIQMKGYPPDILLIQANVEVPNIFDHAAITALEFELYAKAYEILKKRGGKKEFSEEYSVFSVSGMASEDPDGLLKKYGHIVASLLKSENLELDPDEVKHTLSAQIKYAKNDVAIIDWDGAFLFDPKGDIEATIELLTLANLQLLRHRILDHHLDNRLIQMSRLAHSPQQKWYYFKPSPIANELREIIKYRMESLSSFQELEREIKLIGDWYSARVYELAAKKLKIGDWKLSIKEKLDSIEDIYSTISENFTVSLKDSAEWIQIVAWFILIVLEFIAILR